MVRRVMLIAALAVARAGAAPFLSPADIEKATGLKGVHLVPATAPGSVPGRDNYADASGKVVLWFQTMSRPDFARARRQPATQMNGIVVEKALFHASVAGLGDDAFDSPDGSVQHALYVVKGEAAFGLISNVDAAGAPRITMPQLKTIAKAVVAGM
jgi:hypothetical protein